MRAPGRARPDPKTVVAAGAGLIAGVALMYLPPVYAAAGATTVALIFNVVEVSAALTLMALILRVWWSAERGEPIKAIAGCLASGLVLWALAQGVYAYYQLRRGPGYVGPTPADALWVVGYLPIIYGLYLRLHTLGLRETVKRWPGILAANLVLDALAVYFVVRPMFEAPNPAQPLMIVISLLYIIGDLTIVLAASLIVQSFARGRMATPWSLVAAGCLMFSSSDLLFAYGTSNGSFRPAGDPILTPVMFGYNLLLFSAYVTAAVGAYWLGRLHRVI